MAAWLSGVGSKRHYSRERGKQRSPGPACGPGLCYRDTATSARSDEDDLRAFRHVQKVAGRDDVEDAVDELGDLPRERRELVDDGQPDLFGGADKPVAHGEAVSGALTEASLIADFGPRLGGRTKVRNFMLGKLARLGFIERRNGLITEGPLLDLALDYRVLADRIIHGTLGEVLAAAGQALPESNAFTHADILAEALPDDDTVEEN